MFFVFFWARKMGTSVHSLCISRVLNNDHSLETMKRGRPAKHPGYVKRYKLELGVGENAKKAYETWYAYLYKFQDCSRATAKVRKWTTMAFLQHTSVVVTYALTCCTSVAVARCLELCLCVVDHHKVFVYALFLVTSGLLYTDTLPLIERNWAFVIAWCVHIHQEVPVPVQSQVAPGRSFLPGITEEPNYQAITDQSQQQQQTEQVPAPPAIIYQVRHISSYVHVAGLGDC